MSNLKSVSGATYANDVVYCIVQLAMGISIVIFSIYTLIAFRRSENCNRHNFWFLVLPNAVFDIVSLFCIAAVSIGPLCELTDDDDHYSHHSHAMFFPCNLIYLQNITFVCVLFIRCMHIFDESSLYRVRLNTKILFFVALSFSVAIYVTQVTLQWTIPGTNPMLTCALTLCLINVLFAVGMESLLLRKLVRVVSCDTSRDSRGKSVTDIHRMITKSALLSTIAMSSTILSCFFLLIRFDALGNRTPVRIVSEWLVSCNMYLNFFTNLVSHAPYHKLYRDICEPMEKKCRGCFLTMVFGSIWNAEASQFLNPPGLEPRASDIVLSTRTRNSIVEAVIHELPST